MIDRSVFKVLFDITDNIYSYITITVLHGCFLFKLIHKCFKDTTVTEISLIMTVWFLLLPIRMVSDLIEDHAADWDVYLPAKVFSLCFKEHSKTKERPFSVLCCKGLQPVHSPRGLNVSVGFEHLSFEEPFFSVL